MIERGNPLSAVTPVTSQITDLLGAVHRIHDNWVAFSGHGAAEVDVNLTEKLRHAETNPTCEIHEGYCTSHQNSRHNSSLGYICPGEPHQRSPNAPKFEDQSQEETEWQEQGAREAAVEAGQMLVKIKGA